MNRLIPANLLANISVQNGENAILIELLTTTVIRVTDAMVDLSYGGNVFEGGDLIDFPLPKESMSLNTGESAILLSGVNLNHILNLQDGYFGRPVNMYLASIVDGQVYDAMLIYAGEIKKVNFVEDADAGKNTVSVSVANPLFDFGETRGHIASNAYQQRVYASDKTFEFVVNEQGVSR